MKPRERSCGREWWLYYSKSLSKLILDSHTLMTNLFKWSDWDCLHLTWRISQILTSSLGFFLIAQKWIIFLKSLRISLTVIRCCLSVSFSATRQSEGLTEEGMACVICYNPCYCPCVRMQCFLWTRCLCCGLIREGSSVGLSRNSTFLNLMKWDPSLSV